MLKNLLPILFIFLISCVDSNDPDLNDFDPSDVPKIRVIKFPCEKFNGSTDWEYCDPVTLDLSQYQELDEAIMTYVLASTRGVESYMIAELYDLTNNKPILLSQARSEPVDFFTKAKTDDILFYLPKEPVQITIRFRNTTPNPDGYINNESYLTLYLK